MSDSAEPFWVLLTNREISYTSDYSQAKNVLSFLFLSDGIPIVYAGEEQHYSGSGVPYNREATWLSGYSTTAELYQWISTTNAIRKLAISLDSNYITYKVRTGQHSRPQNYRLLTFFLEQPLLHRQQHDRHAQRQR